MKIIKRLVNGELREYLTMTTRRVKLRTPEAVARRGKYKADKPKMSRIRCQHCNKRFTPKRISKRFCTDLCRNKSNILEHKLFEELGIYTQWYKLPIEVRKSTAQIELLRELLDKVA